MEVHGGLHEVVGATYMRPGFIEFPIAPKL